MKRIGPNDGVKKANTDQGIESQVGVVTIGQSEVSRVFTAKEQYDIYTTLLDPAKFFPEIAAKEILDWGMLKVLRETAKIFSVLSKKKSENGLGLCLLERMTMVHFHESDYLIPNMFKERLRLYPKVKNQSKEELEKLRQCLDEGQKKAEEKAAPKKEFAKTYSNVYMPCYFDIKDIKDPPTLDSQIAELLKANKLLTSLHLGGKENRGSFIELLQKKNTLEPQQQQMLNSIRGLSVSQCGSVGFQKKIETKTLVGVTSENVENIKELLSLISQNEDLLPQLRELEFGYIAKDVKLILTLDNTPSNITKIKINDIHGTLELSGLSALKDVEIEGNIEVGGKLIIQGCSKVKELRIHEHNGIYDIYSKQKYLLGKVELKDLPEFEKLSVEYRMANQNKQAEVVFENLPHFSTLDLYGLEEKRKNLVPKGITGRTVLAFKNVLTGLVYSIDHTLTPREKTQNLWGVTVEY